MAEVSFDDNADLWFFAGLTSSFSDITESTTTSSGKLKITDTTRNSIEDESKDIAACRVFEKLDVHLEPSELTPEASLGSIGLREQILVFRYRGKFHAIDHKCPHRSYALSRGTIHDIEDFGIALSAGITCPKHGWSFDIHTGESDRGPYRLPTYDVQVRKARPQPPSDDKPPNDNDVEELWVRRIARSE